MCKSLYFLLFLAIPIIGFSQSNETLKKKYFGTYVGTMSGYLLDTGQEVVTVEPTELTIQLSENAISMDIGRFHITGDYRIIFSNKEYWVLNATIEGQLQTERITVYKKGNTIMREGVYPQSNTDLEKSK